MKKLMMTCTLTLLMASGILVGCKNDSGNINANENSTESMQSQNDDENQADIGASGHDASGESESNTEIESDIVGEVVETLDEEAENAITPTITSAEAKTLMEEDSSLIIIDLRALGDYERGHISRAVQIALEDLEGLVAQGLRDKKVAIIIYSDSRIASQEAVDILEAMEFTNVKSLGSIEDWEYDLVEGAE